MQDVVPVMSSVLIDHSADMQYIKALKTFARIFLDRAWIRVLNGTYRFYTEGQDYS